MGEKICEAERIGLRVGSTIFLVAGTSEIVCKNCSQKEGCPYKIKDKKAYKEKIAKETDGNRR